MPSRGVAVALPLLLAVAGEQRLVGRRLDLGQPDDREIKGPTATFKVKVVGLINEAALPDLKVQACAAVDTLCQSPLREPVITYKDAIVTVAGLQQNASSGSRCRSTDQSSRSAHFPW